jgi:hypothetical protein
VPFGDPVDHQDAEIDCQADNEYNGDDVEYVEADAEHSHGAEHVDHAGYHRDQDVGDLREVAE